MFECDKCGCCCRHLDKSELYKELDRGDGICRYLEGNICSIYETRPILCQIDLSYDLYFRQYLDREQYYRLNKAACQKLKKEEQ